MSDLEEQLIVGFGDIVDRLLAEPLAVILALGALLALGYYVACARRNKDAPH